MIPEVLHLFKKKQCKKHVKFDHDILHSTFRLICPKLKGAPRVFPTIEQPDHGIKFFLAAPTKVWRQLNDFKPLMNPFSSSPGTFLFFVTLFNPTQLAKIAGFNLFCQVLFDQYSYVASLAHPPAWASCPLQTGDASPFLVSPVDYSHITRCAIIKHHKPPSFQI